MSFVLCERFGFDEAGIARRLALTGLSARRGKDLAEELQDQVIRPGVGSIVDEFYGVLGQEPGFARIVTDATTLSHLRTTQRVYLLSLGVDYDSQDYFEHRLRVGATHARVGVSLPLYQCAYRILQSLLIEGIPESIQGHADAWRELVQFIVKITSLDMSLAIETYYLDAVDTLERTLDEMRHEGEAMKRSLQTDTLTGVHSRAYGLQALRAAFVSARRAGTALSVVMLDLDHFKTINDRHGHVLGDRVLRAVASRIKGDARDRDIVARYGGEEFIVVLPDTELAGAVALAERIRETVGGDPIHTDTLALSMTLSAGVAELGDGDDAESLTRRADGALYAAKSAGRNCVRTASPASGHQPVRMC